MSHSEGQSVDRRSSARKNVRVPVEMKSPHESPLISGRIQDISPGGMKVKTETNAAPLKKRDEVWFLVNRDYLKFQGQGEILWTSRGGDAVGIKFTLLDKKSKRSLEEFLRLFVDLPSSIN